MPILLWPFPSGFPPPITRGGPLFQLVANPVNLRPDPINTPLYDFGPDPTMLSPATMLINLGPGLPINQSALDFNFTRPDGTMFHGTPSAAFVGQPTVQENRIPDYLTNQYVIYNFAQELDQMGRWLVRVIAANYFSQLTSFHVGDGGLLFLTNDTGTIFLTDETGNLPLTPP